MPAGMVAEPPPHPTPLIWLASSLITLEAAIALAVITGFLLSGLPAVSCGAGFWWGAVGGLFLWSLAWPAAGVGLLVGVKLIALRGWALFLALGIEGGLLFAVIKLMTVPMSLRVVVGSVAVIVIALLAASMNRFREGPPTSPEQERRTEQLVAAAATSEAILVERPQRRWGSSRRSSDDAGALGCAILLVGLWEALGIVLLSNRQVRYLMLAAVGFGALGNLTLGGATTPTLTDGLPNRVTQVDMLMHPETRLYYPDADPVDSVITANGCSSDATATTHLVSHTSFPTIYKWYRSWLVEEHWQVPQYETPSFDYLGPGLVFNFERGKREAFTLTIDSPPAIDAVPGATYFEASYQIKGG